MTDQEAAIRDKLTALSEKLKAIEALKEEVLQMQTVNFRKYADIIVNLQMKNEMYWMIKYFDGEFLDRILGRFDKESARIFLDAFKCLREEAIQFQQDGLAPESREGERPCQTVLEYADGIFGRRQEHSVHAEGE